MEPQQLTPTVPPQPIVEEKLPRSNKTFKILLLVFHVLLFGAVITYAVQNYQPEQEIMVPPTEPTITQPVDETADWEKYRSDDYGFEFKYPRDWSATNHEQEDMEFYLVLGAPDNVGRLSVSVEKNTNKLTLEEWIANLDDPRNSSFDSVTVKGETLLDNKPASMLSIFRFDHSAQSVVSSHNNNFISVEYPSEDPNDPNFSENKKTYDQILSSFRFVQQDISSNPLCGEKLITEQETYKNNEYGFSIDYPKGWVIDSPAYGGKYMGGFERNEDKHYVLGIACTEPQGDWTMVITAIDSSFADLEKTSDFKSMFKSKEIVQINNQSAVKVLHDNNTISYYFEKPDKSLVINIGGPFNDSPPVKSYEENAKNILPSFKFIE